ARGGAGRGAGGRGRGRARGRGRPHSGAGAATLDSVLDPARNAGRSAARSTPRPMTRLLVFFALANLPIVRVPATGPASDTAVVFVSGDGGWAAIDKGISRVLAANGMPVTGLDALKYFWSKRTPDEAARDLQRIIDG